MPARLLLVDDHNLFRTGLRLIVQDHPSVGSIAEAGSVAQACALQMADADLVLLDIQLPGMSGLDGLRLIRQACPKARIVLVSASVAPDAVNEARARGADGFFAQVGQRRRHSGSHHLRPLRAALLSCGQRGCTDTGPRPPVRPPSQRGNWMCCACCARANPTR